jgi:CRP-like cAMP-binding protein
MNVETLTQMLNQFQNNLEELYQSDKVDKSPKLLLGAAYKELGVASEELQVALEELIIQAEELMAAQIQLDAERLHYKNLFEFLPNAYLVTNAQGKILQANQASATLLNLEPRFLTGKPLDIFLSPKERQTFSTKLALLRRAQQTQKWSICLQPRNQEPLDVFVSVAPSCDRSGKLVNLCWSMYNLPQISQSRSNHQLPIHNSDLFQERPKYTYHQGEIIPIEPNILWIVSQGWVKLNTTNTFGEQVLVGLVGKNMPFGSSLTCLPTYQGTVLSKKVQLVSISLTEINESPHLRELLLPKIIQRLLQTESLMAVSGVRQIPTRICQLLLWLKENFGQSASQGTRLSIRLTHQELASACGTTRVTITRELSRLKKEGAIAYDDRHHLIFNSEKESLLKI